MALRLPRSEPDSQLSYRELLGSLLHLWREFGELRLASVTQALIFAAFTAFWTILALRLQQPQFGLGAQVAGLFGIIGTVGVLVAPLAGRVADRHGPHRVIALGAVGTLVAWVIFRVWSSLAGLVVGVIVLDFAVQSAMVSNQHVIYALRPEARSRINTVYVGAMFIGGSVGSAAATVAWDVGGWNALALLGIGLAGVAAGLQLGNIRRRGEFHSLEPPST
jgi:predicted MFS family arabinose efflux permease